MSELERVIRQRRSTRMFLPHQPVPQELVYEALNLAVRAPSNSNIQPWHTVFATGAARDRLVTALETLGPHAGTVFTPLESEGPLVEAGVLARPMAELEKDWRTRVTDTFEPLGLPLAPATSDPWLGRTEHGEAFRWLWGEFTSVRRSDPAATW